MNLKNEIRNAAFTLGFDFAAVTNTSSPPYADAFLSWLDNSFHGDMKWMENNPERRMNPRILWPEGSSIVTVGMLYNQSAPEKLLDDPSRGQIAMYAWGQDYHDVIEARLKILLHSIRYLCNCDVQGKWYVDTGPLLEKPIAMKAGLGFIGKNSLLIHPVHGSWFFLGELLLDLELEPDEQPVFESTCATCSACQTKCPTKALTDDYMLDASRCINYLTIENRGPIPKKFRESIGNRIFGCDTCQQKCPYNSKLQLKTSMSDFLLNSSDRAAPPLLKMIQLTDKQFKAYFSGSAVLRAKRHGLLRNVAVALGNWGTSEAVPYLADALRDKEPLIRGHAAWALGKIGSTKAMNALFTAATWESDLYVLSEIKTAMK